MGLGQDGSALQGRARERGSRRARRRPRGSPGPRGPTTSSSATSRSTSAAGSATATGSRTPSIPRADAKLALRSLREAGTLGRGVWVFDASDTNNFTQKLTIPLRYPNPRSDFEARVFGPFLVIRSKQPTRTPKEFLIETRQAQILGRSLGAGDADVNLLTADQALSDARAASGFALDRLLVAGGVLERGQARGVRRGAARSGSAPSTRGRDHGRRADQAADEKRAEALGPAIGAVHGRDSTRRVKRSWRCASAPSAICCSTSSSARAARAGPKRRAPPRRGSARAARRRTSRRGRPSSEPRRGSSASAGSDAAGELAGARAPCARRRAARPRRGGPERRRRLARLAGREPDDADRPRRRAGPARRGARRALVRRLRVAPPVRLLAAAAPDRGGRGEGRGRGAGAGRTDQRRPRLGVGDRRVRAGEAPRRGSSCSGPSSCSRTRASWTRSAARCPGRSCSSAAPTGSRVDGADYPALPADVVDTTGAGDALAAGFLVGGPELAAQAAARCVAQLGAMP